MKALLLLLPNLAVLLGRLLRDPGVPRTAMDEVTFSRLFDNREGPYHLYDSHDRP